MMQPQAHLKSRPPSTLRVVASSNLDLAINALVLIRNAQRAVDTALRLPAEDRAAVAEQVEEVRRNVGQVAGSLAGTIPGAQSLAWAGQVAAGGLAQRAEFRALTGMVSFFARQGSEALGAVAGIAGSMGGSRDRSLALSERITERLEDVGVATRDDLARELGVEPRSADFQDALERTLGTGRAEWYGSGTYGLPRPELEAMISNARQASEREEPSGDADRPSPGEPSAGLGPAIGELSSSLEELQGAMTARSGEEAPAKPAT